MPGPVALHGGGEFLPGDEPFLLVCLEAAAAAAASRETAPGRAGATDPPGAADSRPTGPAAANWRQGDAAAAGGPQGGAAAADGRPGDAASADGRPGVAAASGRALPAVRAVVVPAAAAAERPDLAAAHGVAALRRVAARAGIDLRAEAAMVVDAASAADAALAEQIAGADLVHLPGGDPGRLLDILDGSDVWRAMLDAHARGAVLAGASAGAMALASWSWTPRGWRPALGLVPGIVVVPHAERVGRSASWAGTFGATIPAGARPVGVLGLDERTGVFIAAGPDGTIEWRVVGAGRAHWSPDAATSPIHARHGELLQPR